MMFFISLPWPPSSNSYYRRGQHATYMSKQGRQFKDEVAELVAESAQPPLAGRLYVSISLSSTTKRAYDIDNRIKATLDSLQDAGVFADDEQIDELSIIRRPPGGGYARVLIIEKGNS